MCAPPADTLATPDAIVEVVVSPDVSSAVPPTPSWPETTTETRHVPRVSVETKDSDEVAYLLRCHPSSTVHEQDQTTAG